MLLIVLVVLAVVPTWADDMRREDLTRWTRHYEEVMAIEQSPLGIRFAEDLGRLDGSEICGLLERPRGIAYSLSKGCKRYRPRLLALHEVCHWRMKHHLVDMPSLKMEDEVHACIHWYRGTK